MGFGPACDGPSLNGIRRVEGRGRATPRNCPLHDRFACSSGQRPLFSATDLSNFLACTHLSILDRATAVREAGTRGDGRPAANSGRSAGAACWRGQGVTRVREQARGR
jgi:hypothetical protein